MTIAQLLIVAAISVAGAYAADARTLQVGTCKQADPTFSTIQLAVNAAFTGDKVAVCPGTYNEQVTITRGITLTKVSGMASPVVAAPSGGVAQNTTTLDGFPTAAQIFVAPAAPAQVTISNLIVDGEGNNDTSCGLELMGIYYQNAGGTIKNNTVRNQMLPDGYQSCQDGEGIFVENQTAGTAAVDVTQNTLNNFDKNGITFSYGATYGEITGNTVLGIGPTDLIAQNGIQIGYGATANINTNTVSNLIYSPGTYGSSGILLYDMQAGNYQATPVITKNTVSSAQYGIVLDAVNGTSSNPVQIDQNAVSYAQFAGVGLYSDSYLGFNDDYVNVAKNDIENTSPYDGIDVCSNNNTIIKNKIVNSSTEAAIHLDSLCGQPDNSASGVANAVKGNHIAVACVGILSGPPQSANAIGKNKFVSVDNEAVYGQDSYSCGPRHAHKRMARNGGEAALPAALRPARR